MNLAGKDMAILLAHFSAVALSLRHSAGLQKEASDLELATRRVLDAGYRTAGLARTEPAKLFDTTKMSLLVEQAFMEILDRRFAFHAV